MIDFDNYAAKAVYDILHSDPRAAKARVKTLLETMHQAGARTSQGRIKMLVEQLHELGGKESKTRIGGVGSILALADESNLSLNDWVLELLDELKQAKSILLSVREALALEVGNGVSVLGEVRRLKARIKELERCPIADDPTAPASVEVEPVQSPVSCDVCADTGFIPVLAMPPTTRPCTHCGDSK